MGAIFGIFAKKENKLINEVPIYAEEESHFSLANIFLVSKKYVEGTLMDAKLEEARKNWLKISDEEEKALIYNNVQDNADEEIRYKKSINEPLPENFRAIKMKYEPTKGEIIFSSGYDEHENWAKVKTMLEALYKIKEVLFEDLKLSIQNNESIEDKKSCLDNIQILYSTVKLLKQREGADEIALIYAPY